MLMDLTSAKHFVCVEYPGRVIDTDKAIETLGGNTQISETFASDKARLHLNFRPQNIFSKGMHGDRVQSSGVLLKVKVKRRKNEVRTEDVQVLGYSDVCYRFQTACDYEMLPLMKRSPESRSPDLIYKDIFPTVDDKKDEWLQNPTPPVPYFFPPHTFSRFDPTANRKLFKDCQSLRGRRFMRDVHRFDFSLTDPLPTDYTAEQFNTRKGSVEELEVLREKFKTRPVCSFNRLRAETKISPARLKYMLPFVAYYYISGPWRACWLMFGYDPRKDFQSRQYQVLDLRLNKKAVYNIKTREQKVRSKDLSTAGKKTVVTQLVFDGDATTLAETDHYCPIFASGYFHHLGYVNLFQFCDIEVPRIQELLEKVPAPQHGGKCSEKTGWLPVGFDEQARGILFEILKDHFQMEMQAKSNEQNNQAEEAREMQMDEEEDYDEDDQFEEE